VGAAQPQKTERQASCGSLVAREMRLTRNALESGQLDDQEGSGLRRDCLAWEVLLQACPYLTECDVLCVSNFVRPSVPLLHLPANICTVLLEFRCWDTEKPEVPPKAPRAGTVACWPLCCLRRGYNRIDLFSASLFLPLSRTADPARYATSVRTVHSSDPVLTTAAVETLHFTIFSAMSIALTQLFVFTVSWRRVDRKVICCMYNSFSRN
jgi:hypothetical protein